MPHQKLAQILRERTYVLAPGGTNITVQAHVMLDDPNHPASELDKALRMSLLDAGANPADLGFIDPVAIEPGWTPEAPT